MLNLFQTNNDMKKTIKVAGFTLAGIIVLLLILPYLYKDKLIQLAKDEVNKQVNARIDFGTFDLSLFSSFPDFRFTINDIRVIGKNEFNQDTLLYIKTFRSDVNILSLIRGKQIEVREIRIEEPRIKALVLANGKSNWDILKPSHDTLRPPIDSSKMSFKLGLKRFEINKAQISYQDIGGNLHAAVSNFDFVLSGDFTQDHFDMQLFSEIQQLTCSVAGISYAKNMHLKFKSLLAVDMPQQKFTLKENEIMVNELALGINGFIAMPDTNVDMDFRFYAKQSEFKQILSLIPAVYSKEFATVQTSGILALNGFVKGRYNRASLPAFGLHVEISNAMFKYPSLPKSCNQIWLLCDLHNPNGKPDATRIDISRFHLEMAGNPIDIQMHIQTPVSDPNIQGDVKGKVDLSSLKDIIPLEKGEDMKGIIQASVHLQGKMSAITQKKYQEFNTEGNLDVDQLSYKTASLPYSVFINQMKLRFTPQVVELIAFESKIGNTDLHMEGKIENFMAYTFQDSLLKGNFSLYSNQIDLNQLMSTSSPADTAPSDTGKKSTSGVTEVPKNLDVMVHAEIKKLLYDKMDITNMSGQLAVQKARLTIENSKLNMLGGTMQLSGYYDTKEVHKPLVHFTFQANDFDIQQTALTFNSVPKLVPIASSTKGKFTTTLNHFTGSLTQEMNLDLTSISGSGVFQTKSVAIEHFPPFEKLDDALHMNKLKSLHLNDLAVSYEFKDGRMFTQPFKLKVADLPCEISGSTGFDQSIDYKWAMEIPVKLIGVQGQQAIQALFTKAGSAVGTTIAMPEKVNVIAYLSGTVTKPQIKTGIKGDKNNQQTLMNQVKQTVVSEVKQTASQQAEKILAEAKQQAEVLKAQAAALSQQGKDQVYRAADSLVAKASNPIQKLAAKKLADKMKKEADAKAQKTKDEAAAKTDKILADAQTQADRLK